MKRSIVAATIVVMILFATYAFGLKSGGRRGVFPKTATQISNTDILPGRIVIKFREALPSTGTLQKSGLASVDELLFTYGVQTLRPVSRHSLALGKGVDANPLRRIYYADVVASDPLSAAAALAEDPAIEYAEPLYMHKLSAVPNDSLVGRQDYLTQSSVQAAWDLVKAEDGNVVLAIIDGGTDRDHPDLAENFWLNTGEFPNNGIDDDRNGFIDDLNGWNFRDDNNDPTGHPSTPGSADHGTATAGIACAVADNQIGIAGVSWNARLMAINAAHPTSDLSIAFGYDGLIYALENGADIVNLSWGRFGGPSLFEQDVIETAVQAGVTVVAAAGNESSSVPGFPASYDGVFAVAAVLENDRKAGFSNFGEHIDLAATGIFMLSTINNGGYSSQNGTSFSSPIVAGVAALVRTQHPDWTAIQVGEQVRVTADDISARNPEFIAQLGKGRVNAARAVTVSSPSIRLTDTQLVDSSGDGVIEPGESVDISLQFINYLAAASNVGIRISTEDPFVSLGRDATTISSIGTLELAETAQPLQIQIANAVPSGHRVSFLIDITAAGGYSDIARMQLTVLPTFGNTSANNIAVTLTSVGRIGFADPINSDDGLGFRHQNGPNLLFEGAIIAGTGPDRLVNAARGAIIDETQFLVDDDFEVDPDGHFRFVAPGTRSDQESFGVFTDGKALNPLNVRITQQSFAQIEPPHDDYVILRYDIENTGAEALHNFNFGYYFDWDIDGQTFVTNVTGVDIVNRLAYAFDDGEGPQTYVGMAVLSGGGFSYRGIFNEHDNPANPSWGLFDGFTKEEKWEAISKGVQNDGAGIADISFVVGTGPFSIEPDSTLQLIFALVAGNSLDDLRASIALARDFTDANNLNDRPIITPEDFTLEASYPNPFDRTRGQDATITYTLNNSGNVQLEVYNILGQKVRTLINRVQSAGSFIETWNGLDDGGRAVASGVYIYRLRSAGRDLTRKLLILR